MKFTNNVLGITWTAKISDIRAEYKVIGAEIRSSDLSDDPKPDNSILAKKTLTLHGSITDTAYDANPVCIYRKRGSKWQLISVDAIARTQYEVARPYYKKHGLVRPDPVLNVPTQPMYIGESYLGTIGPKLLDPVPISSLPTEPFDWKQSINLVLDRAEDKIYVLNQFQTLYEARLLMTMPANGAIEVYGALLNHVRRIFTFKADGTCSRLSSGLTSVLDTLHVPVDSPVVKVRTSTKTHVSYLITDFGSVYEVPSSLASYQKIDTLYPVSDYDPDTGKAIDGLGTLIEGSIDGLPYPDMFEICHGVSSSIDNASGTYSTVDWSNGSQVSAPVLTDSYRIQPNSINYAEQVGDTQALADAKGIKLPKTPSFAVIDGDPKTYMFLAHFCGVKDPLLTPIDSVYFYLCRPVDITKDDVLGSYYLTADLEVTCDSLGREIEFTVSVSNTEDANLYLPICLPEGVVWSARNQHGQNVRSARSGDTLQIKASHEWITSKPFAMFLGCAEAMVSEGYDIRPDSIFLESHANCDIGTWYESSVVRISGISDRVKISSDPEWNSSYFHVYVNGSFPTAEYDPATNTYETYVYEGDSLQVRTLMREKGTYPYTVHLGETAVTYVISTEPAVELNPCSHEAYAVLGKITSGLVSNDGTGAVSSDVDVVIHTEGAVWLSTGTNTTHLKIGDSDQIVYTVDEPGRVAVIYSAGAAQYAWNIWADETLADSPPPFGEDRHYMDLGFSEFADFSNMLDGYYSDIYIPAGCRAELNGVLDSYPLDSRQVNVSGYYIENLELSKTQLRVMHVATPEPLNVGLGLALLPFQASLIEGSMPLFSQPELDAITFKREYVTGGEYDSDQVIDLSAVRYVPSRVSVDSTPPITRSVQSNVLYGDALPSRAYPVSAYTKDAVEANVHSVSLSTCIAQAAPSFNSLSPNMIDCLTPALMNVTHHGIACGHNYTFNVVHHHELPPRYATFLTHGIELSPRLNVTKVNPMDRHTARKPPQFGNMSDTMTGTYTTIPAPYGIRFEPVQATNIVHPIDVHYAYVDTALSRPQLAATPEFRSTAPNQPEAAISRLASMGPVLISISGPAFAHTNRSRPRQADVPAFTHTNRSRPRQAAVPVFADTNRSRPRHAAVPVFADTNRSRPVLASVARPTQIQTHRVQLEPRVLHIPRHGVKVEARSTKTYTVRPMNLVPTRVLPITRLLDRLVPKAQAVSIKPSDSNITCGFVHRYLTPPGLLAGPPAKHRRDNSIRGYLPRILVGISSVPDPVLVSASVSLYVSSPRRLVDLYAPIGRNVQQNSQYCDAYAPTSRYAAQHAHFVDPYAPDTRYAAQHAHFVDPYAPETRYALNAVHHYKASVLVTDVVNLSEGETDPFKMGYFSTELEALRNATDVWGQDPNAVYAIQHPNLVWTWAKAVECGQICGSTGCNARGYISGG